MGQNSKNESLDRQVEKIKQRMIKKLDTVAPILAKDIGNFYLDEVSKFYTEFPPPFPIVYKRHPYSDIQDSGMGRTFNMIIKKELTKDSYVIYSGITLHTYNMYSDYRGRKDFVLYTFSQGIHGLPDYTDAWGHFRPAIRGNVKPIEDTKEHIRELKKHGSFELIKLLKQSRM